MKKQSSTQFSGSEWQNWTSFRLTSRVSLKRPRAPIFPQSWTSFKASSQAFHVSLSTNGTFLHWVTNHFCTSNKPCHSCYDDVPPLPLLSIRALWAQTRRWGQIQPFIHSHKHTSMAWRSPFDADAKRLVHWKPPTLLFPLLLLFLSLVLECGKRGGRPHTTHVVTWCHQA